MIYISLIGGLGNQMFQYALGRSLELKYGREVVFDSTFLHINKPGNTKRFFELDKFNTVVERRKNFFFIQNAFLSIVGLGKKVIKEKLANSFDPEILKCNNVYLFGYWQSFKYFNDIRANLIEEFTIRDSMSLNVRKLKEEIDSKDSVGVHVRRGDYVTNKAAAQYHGTCSLDYYNNALAYIMEQKKDLHFFVFSDDIDWAKENLKITPNITFVSGNEGHIDMFLFSVCKHKITANSSFSWWAAFLGEETGTVVYPKNWFKKKEVDENDFFPANWISINN